MSGHAPRMILMRMHRAWDGTCWAESDDLPGFTAIGADFMETMKRVREPFGISLEHDLIDLRWAWCDTDRKVTAVRYSDEPSRTPGSPCPCEAESGRAYQAGEVA